MALQCFGNSWNWKYRQPISCQSAFFIIWLSCIPGFCFHVWGWLCECHVRNTLGIQNIFLSYREEPKVPWLTEDSLHGSAIWWWRRARRPTWACSQKVRPGWIQKSSLCLQEKVTFPVHCGQPFLPILFLSLPVAVCWNHLLHNSWILRTVKSQSTTFHVVSSASLLCSLLKWILTHEKSTISL